MANQRQNDPVLPDPNSTVDPNAVVDPVVDPAIEPEDMALTVVSCESFLRTQAKGGGVRYRSVLSGSDAALARFKVTQGIYYLETEQKEPLFISQESLKVNSKLVENNGRYGPKVVVSEDVEKIAKADFLASKAGLSAEAKGSLFTQLILGMV